MGGRTGPGARSCTTIGNAARCWRASIGWFSRRRPIDRPRHHVDHPGGLVMLGLGTPQFSGDGVNVDIDLGSEALDAPIEYLLWGVVSLAWSTVRIKTRSATPGKMLAKLPIVEAATGDAPSTKIAALRSPNELLPIAGLISVDAGEIAVVVVGTTILGFISLILLNSDPERRTVMDRLSGTRVLRR